MKNPLRNCNLLFLRIVLDLQRIHANPQTINKMCQTIYPPRNGIADQNIIALTSFNTASGLMNVTINLALIYGLWKLNLLRKTSYKFILCMCIGDACVGLFTQPTFSTLLLLKNAKNQCLHEIVAHSIQTAFCQFSVLMILVITMDRFIHMTYLTRYNIVMTRRRGFLLIISNLMITIMIALINMIASVYGFQFEIHMTTIAINTIIFIFIFVIYSKTYLAIRSRVQDSHLIRCNLPGSKMMTAMDGRRLNLVKPEKYQHHHYFGKAMVFVLLALGGCYLPYFIIITYTSYLRFYAQKGVPIDNWKTVCLFWSMQLVYLNSTVNSIIVIFSSKQLKTFARNRLKGKKGESSKIATRKTNRNDSAIFQNGNTGGQKGMAENKKSRSLSI